MNIKHKYLKVFCLILCLFTILFSINITHANAYGWGFSRNSNHSSPSIGKYASEIEGTNSYYLGNETSNEIFLTFDAGYDNGVMASILKTLKEKNIKASFFITGDFINRFPDLVLDMTSSGHLICNHSYSHKSLLKLSNEDIKRDLEKNEQCYFNLTGKKMANCFRPPMGEFDHKSLLYVSSLGYKNIFWSMAHFDWDTNKQMSKDKTIEVVMNNLHSGAIILLHSVSISNAEALPTIIDQCIEKGYTFKTVDQLN